MDKFETFRALHVPGKPFILANVWDVGSARMLAGMGAKALATSSAALAFVQGSADLGVISRDDALAHAEEIAAATDLPVQGDFENGFGDDPDVVAETVRLAAEVGLAGICVEDLSYPACTPYPAELATERTKAGAAAARALRRDFVFVARADGVMHGLYDMQEALARVAAFDAAGADALYVPLPPTMDDLARICAATRKPVNALAAGAFTASSLGDFAAAGVARVSLGSSLARVTHRAIFDAAQAMLGQGDFTPLAQSISGGEVEALIAKGAASA
ncbi:isocitrate lyase/phosphoenolpyruvate mutase family protein [Oceanicola sp. 502str15]|uniref:isocitrate lyase/PEP mutase family protein n=1 Tax=Oceanicola sp. 502str15 TaxID=2696061 RepID=UPI00209590AE|nr:isocitrate lyase/phosphoenolpyruvate mutase family protein [Oceanicola sp. 502str15]MCO6382291.1 isocitrate lyase/phosphoenolpyruvate mutase family protein [Oceanicola sp. 502str15]